VIEITLNADLLNGAGARVPCQIPTRARGMTVIVTQLASESRCMIGRAVPLHRGVTV
jgi:hypothetical protein